ncbi:histidinol dehydrogenase [Pelagibacterales bacterium SAG-MED17]|nr:histidinol dehydrogenase [Pelagibacterales bacterium SAG-MED17]
MIKLINCNKKNYLNILTKFLDLRRSGKKTENKVISKILKDIKNNKNKSLLKYEKKFSKNSQIKPNIKQIDKAIKSLDPKIKRAIDFSYKRILKFHAAQKTKDIFYIDSFNNKIEYKYVPIQSVGIYVPANLPSTLLMNAIPAKIAGVKRIVLANPKNNGKLNPAVLYAAKKLGISEIYSMGGAQAIGSLAYIQKVNKIVGPGNVFVAGAKRQVFGDVGIEGMIAGPSEITVLADSKTNLNEVTTSMIGQAEHDSNSQCILITKDLNLIKKFKKDLELKLKEIPRKSIATKSIKSNGLVLKVYNDKQIIDIINEIAPEHLEINVGNYKKYKDKIFNAGSICIGKYSPMALSDYAVGTNHVLPTNSSAKFSSGLNLSEFYKKISLITLSKKGVEKIGEYATHLAEYEELKGHALSIKSRIRRNNIG